MTLKSREALRGERNPNAALTRADVLTIRRRYAEGATQGQLCRAYGVSITTIARIVNFETWAWVREDEPAAGTATAAPFGPSEELPPLTPEQEQAAAESAQRLQEQAKEEGEP